MSHFVREAVENISYKKFLECWLMLSVNTHVLSSDWCFYLALSLYGVYAPIGCILK